MAIASEKDLIEAAGSEETWREIAGPYDADPESPYQRALRKAQNEGDAIVQSYLGITFRDIEELDPDDVRPIVMGAAKLGVLELKDSHETGLTDADERRRERLLDLFHEMARGKRWTGKKRPKPQSNRKPCIVEGVLGRKHLRGFVGE